MINSLILFNIFILAAYGYLLLKVFMTMRRRVVALEKAYNRLDSILNLMPCATLPMRLEEMMQKHPERVLKATIDFSANDIADELKKLPVEILEDMQKELVEADEYQKAALIRDVLKGRTNS